MQNLFWLAEVLLRIYDKIRVLLCEGEKMNLLWLYEQYFNALKQFSRNGVVFNEHQKDLIANISKWAEKMER